MTMGDQGTVRVRYDDGAKDGVKAIILEASLPNGVVYEYPITLDQCDTHEKILSWVLHLAEKNWMDKGSLRLFATEALERNGVVWPKA